MIDPEYLLLSALTQDPAACLPLSLEPHHFRDSDAQALYGVIRALATQGKPFDLLAVRDAGVDLRFVMSITRDGCGSLANVAAYAERIRDAWKLRELERIGRELADSACERGAEADALVARVMGEVNDLASESKGFDFDMKSLAALVVDEVNKAHEAAEKGETIGIPTGLTRLDAALGGLHRSDLVIVAGRPGMGKTAFGMGLAEYAAKRGYKVGFVSAEMPGPQLGKRLAAMMGGVAYSRLRNGNLTEQDWPRLTEGINQMAKLPLRIYAQPGCRVGDVVRQATVWKRSFGLDVLLVDYLGRLQPDRELERPDLTIGEMAKALKTAAVALDVALVCFAQLNRGVDARVDKRPYMSDLYGSSQIEAEADSILMLYRPGAYDDDADQTAAEILVEKNRHGETGLVPAYFDGPLMRWRDAGWRAEV